MSLAGWNVFSLYFAAEGNKKARSQRRAFLQQQGEEVESPEEETDAFRMAFMAEYGIYIDWKEGIFTLLEALDEQLDDKSLSVAFDYESDTATVTLAGSDYRFPHRSMGEDGFSEGMAEIEALLLTAGYGLRVQMENLESDTLTLLLMPETAWQRAEAEFGIATVSGHFQPLEQAYSMVDQEILPTEEMPAPDVRAASRKAPKTGYPLWIYLPALCFLGWIVYKEVFADSPPSPAAAQQTCVSNDKRVAGLVPEKGEALKAWFDEKSGCE